MLTSLRIQNFRSIRDASVKLGQVNLFIGPNNSGKSNFLKGIEFLAKIVQSIPNGYSMDESLFDSLLFRNSGSGKRVMAFDIEANDSEGETKKYTINFNNNSTKQVDITNLTKEEHMEELMASLGKAFTPRMYLLHTQFIGAILYKIEPASFNLSVSLAHEPDLSASGSNIVNFVYNIGQNYKSRFRALEADFANCVQDLVSISTPADPNRPGNLKLKFFDRNDNAYWAEEVSEGVLYFLALLCIVHQPGPPKLLLLEEPEKGIHPRRIREVMDFIFELARLRDIQIILTSHSPYVVDHFADIPECISVFDRENGETIIRNAADIIAETNATLKQPIRYSDALGEHWVSGFLGGVPL